MNFGDFDLFTLVGYSFVRKNAKIDNQMIVGKNSSRSSKLDQPRLSISIRLKVKLFLGKILDGGCCICQIPTLLLWSALASRGNMRTLKDR